MLIIMWKSHTIASRPSGAVKSLPKQRSNIYLVISLFVFWKCSARELFRHVSDAPVWVTDEKIVIWEVINIVLYQLL